MHSLLYNRMMLHLNNNVQPFSTSTTDMPFYDNMLAKPQYYKEKKGIVYEIIWITPAQYFELIGRMRHNSIFEERNYGIDPQLVSRYSEDMLNGSKFPMPVIDYSRTEQEGRHRALAAESINVNFIPVMIVSTPRQS